MKFIPDQPMHNAVIVPFFEDVNSKTAPGYSSTLSIEKLKSQCLEEFTKLGASDVLFTQGTVKDESAASGEQNRPAYQVAFRIYGATAEMILLGFPCRKDANIDRSRKQALFVYRDWLKGEAQMRLYQPNYMPFVSNLIAEGKTLAEWLMESGKLPMLASGKADES